MKERNCRLALAGLILAMLAGDTSSALATSAGTELIAFVSKRASDVVTIENEQIVVIAANGRAKRMLTLNPRTDNYDPQWSPDGKRMLFWRRPGGHDLAVHDPDLFVMSSDGSAQRMLLVDRDDSLDDDLMGAVWSPNGKQIAFNRHFQIYVMNADGGHRRRLAPCDGCAEGVGWSPDGKRIAFVNRYRDALYAVNADGGGFGRLANGGEPDFEWSPTGKALLFTTGDVPTLDNPDPPHEIHVINVGRYSRPRNVTQNPAHDYSPAWSPDGHRIVFVKHRIGERARIWVMNADGSGQRRVGIGEDPSWSPDGRRLVFVAGGEIYVMNANGSHRHRLTRDPFVDRGPTWRPHRRTIR